jgi:hypothetical protein
MFTMMRILSNQPAPALCIKNQKAPAFCTKNQQAPAFCTKTLRRFFDQDFEGNFYVCG